MSDTATAVRSALTWFEIPSADFDRARAFYQTILEAPMREEVFGTGRIALFPYAKPGVGGALEESSETRPSAEGTLVYLDVDGRLDRTLELVVANGGRVVFPKTALPPGMGWTAHIIDSEGNRVGLHAIN